MSAIISVEKTGGGEKAYCCDEIQKNGSMNLTITTPDRHGRSKVNRIRLCDACAHRLYDKMKHYLPTKGS